MIEVISAREAFDRGAKRYFTGLPCRRGHVAERMVSNGVCVECLKARTAQRKSKAYENTKRWREANPSSRAEEARRYRKKHPDKVAVVKARYRARHLEEIREKDRLARQRMRTVNPAAEKARQDRYYARKEAERAALAGRPRPTICDICGPDAVGRIVFDHSHAHGGFRGWLCDRCNKLLGLVKDSPQLLRNLARYLEKDHEQAHREAA